tara:strand:+ start:2649 stop:3521 length:873 start_codon:yes stop_codon:yes gene_type:complete
MLERVMRMNMVFLNGEWVGMDAAKISVFDRGFMFGDAIYEVMAAYRGRIHEKEEHLNRLESSLDSVKIRSLISRTSLEKALDESLIKNKVSNALIYLQISRGVQFPRNHKIDLDIKPTTLITVTEKKILDWKEIGPLELITKDDFRWSRGDIKVTSLIANVMLRNEAVLEGYDDAILVRDEKVTEATSANIFFVKDGVIMTPKKSSFFLHGITRKTVLRLCKESGFKTVERDISKKEIFEADEVWLSSTGNELRPVVKVDGKYIGKNRSLEISVWRKLYEEYRKDSISES